MLSIILIILLAMLLITSFTFRCAIFNPGKTLINLARDIYRYFRYQKWKEWQGFGLVIYIGLFGKGKTLSAVKYVKSQAKRYKLNVYSNIRLNGVEYIPLTNYQQIIEAPSNSIFLIDEISSLFSARSWKDFNINLLFQLLQCRKQKKQIIATAQRFAHVDKLLRDITYRVIDCDKMWRFMRTASYDAWDYENIQNKEWLKPIDISCQFILDEDYNSYDTQELIDNFKKTDFLSNDIILSRRGDVQYNEMLADSKHLKRKLRKKRIK